MAFIPIPNTVEMVLQQAMLNQIINNVLNFEFPEEPDTIDLTDMAGAAIAAWIAEMAPLLSENLDLNAVKCTSLQTASSPSVTEFAPTGTDGDLNVAANPLNVALVISERTGSRGRSFRGRYYQAGTPTTGNANAGSVSGAYQADILTAFIDFITAIETETGATQVVASRYTNNAPRVTGIVTPITSYSANVDFDSQRRRLIGRGA